MCIQVTFILAWLMTLYASINDATGNDLVEATTPIEAVSTLPKHICVHFGKPCFEKLHKSSRN